MLIENIILHISFFAPVIDFEPSAKVMVMSGQELEEEQEEKKTKREKERKKKKHIHQAGSQQSNGPQRYLEGFFSTFQACPDSRGLELALGTSKTREHGIASTKKVLPSKFYDTLFFERVPSI